jgi:hypothetical protein
MVSGKDLASKRMACIELGPVPARSPDPPKAPNLADIVPALPPATRGTRGQTTDGQVDLDLDARR